MQKYPRGSRGSPAKGVVWETVARVRISSSAPEKDRSCTCLFLAFRTRPNLWIVHEFARRGKRIRWEKSAKVIFAEEALRLRRRRTARFCELSTRSQSAKSHKEILFEYLTRKVKRAIIRKTYLKASQRGALVLFCSLQYIRGSIWLERRSLRSLLHKLFCLVF